MGAGSGAGGICAALKCPHARVTLVDTNLAALALARVNARAAGVAVELVARSSVPEGADLVIANPPYMMDAAARGYRHGGSLHGGEVALEWVRDALGKLAPGGSVLLYTGVAIVDGRSPLGAALRKACEEAGADFAIAEIDPDVFGEELEQPAYAEVERIAAVGAVIRKLR
jgi:methylase of polypeptide subunit release factors